MTEIAGASLSRIKPVRADRLMTEGDAIVLVTAPQRWAYAAEADFEIPGIESRGRTVKVPMTVEGGVLGVGWLREDGLDWVTRASRGPPAVRIAPGGWIVNALARG
jgi:hypothetical protein